MADVPNNPIELSKALSGLDYPASKDAILEKVKSNGADQGFVDKIQSMPDREYDGPNAIQHEVFKG